MTSDPQEWESHETLRDGTRVFVRPLKGEDAALYPEFADHVTLADSRLRFFAPVSELSDSRIAELTQLDHDRAMAFIALEEASGKMLGVARLHLDKHQGGEFAVIVGSDIKGRGLATILMRRIIDYARARGLKRIHGQVLAENTAMLNLSAKLGFRIGDGLADPSVTTVTLEL
jgi:acetyltransferase